ncbi:MAG: AsmA family protein [Rubrivivax sp.]|nr:AsmA family protein [Rubrivivax sp.]
MTRQRWVRGLLVGLAVLLLLAGAAIFTAIRYFDRERVIALVATEVRKTTGREIHFDGPIGFRVMPPSLALQLEGVRLANADWSAGTDMLKARRLELVVALAPLLRRQLQIRRVELEGVELSLETDAHGQGNWVMKQASGPPESKPAASSGSPLAIDVSAIDIRDSTLTWRSGQTGQTETLGLAELTLSDAGATDQVDAKIVLRGQPLSIEGHIGDIAQVLAGSDSYPVDLALGLTGARVHLKGSLGLGAKAGRAGLDLEADVSQTAGLAKLAGSNLPLPLPLRFSGRLEQNGARSVLPAFKLALAGQDFAGHADLDTGGKRTRLQLALKAGAVDLGALRPPAPPAAAGKPAPAGRVFSDDPWPLTALPALDAHIDVEAGQLQWPGQGTLSALHATLALSDGQAVLQPLAFRIGSGGVEGAATLRLRAGGVPALSLRVRSEGITLEELSALYGAGGGISGGRTELQADLTGNGASPRQLARSLTGELRFKAGPLHTTGGVGAPGGALLAKLIQAINPSFSQAHGSNVSCAAARLPVKQGTVAVDRSIALESDQLNVVAAGTIDLGAETLDLAFRPTFKSNLGVAASSVARLVKLTGTLASPRIGFDAKGAVLEGLSIGAAVATGGSSLMGQLLTNAPADPHPCLTAMGGKGPAATAPEPGRDAAKKGPSLPDLFRGLFKR